MAYRLVDPLAQSFFIEEPCIVTKVDVFFRTKDSFLPLLCQIRKNEGGFPGKYIIPLSEKIIQPANIPTSADGSLPTTIKFDSPIYLDAGEYSLCLGSDSKRYTAYVSELDSTDLLTGNRIVSQPYMGSLFKSQNATTWTAVQLEDLKFNLYRAIFDTSVQGAIDFTPNIATFRAKVLTENPLQLFNGSDVMRVQHFNHGMPEGSYVKLDNIIEDPLNTTLYGIDLTAIANTALLIDNITLDGYTVTLPNAATQDAFFGGIFVTATQNLVADAMYPIEAKILDSTATITHQIKGTYRDYTQDSDWVTINEGTTELEQTRIITNAVVKTENLAGAESLQYRINLSTTSRYVSPVVDKGQLGLLVAQNLINDPSYATENTLAEDILTFMTSEAGVSFTATSDSAGVLSVPVAYQDAALALTPGTIANVTDSNTTNTGQYRIANISTSGDEISLVKLSGTVATNSGIYSVTIGKNYIAEEAAANGSIYSKYITRKIDFANPSTGLNFRLDVNRPAGTDILVYYKTSLVGEADEISEKEFTLIDNLTLPVSLDDKFTEVEASIEDLAPYESIIIKIAFTSIESSRVPKCKNLRAIALA